MNTFKKKSLYAALAGVSAMGVTGAAQAVNVNPDGLGQVLLYPYYTTRSDGAGNAYSTLMSVVNSTASAKAVKVRFLEGKNSREVLDFNLFLSPFDVWTAAILQDTVTGGARVGTFDLSCTLPPFSTSPTSPFVGFVNFAYTGTSADYGPNTDGPLITGLDRTKEGYFEIIEMATYDAASVTGKAVTHILYGAGATPPSAPPCNSTIGATTYILNDSQATVDALPVTGGLFGSETLLNVNAGTDYTADPVALENFLINSSAYFPAGLTFPDLTFASPARSVVVAPNGSIYQSNWGPFTADAVSATLMHNAVLNEYVLDTATKSQTDWVVTFPTKRFYVNAPFGGNAPKLFQRNFNGSNGSCDDVTATIYDREERNQIVQTFSPPPPTGIGLCWEANVLSFNAGSTSTVFGSTNLSSVPVSFQNGWMNLGFPPPSAMPTAHRLINTGGTSITGPGGGITTGQTVTYIGLPVIGFAAVSYTNGILVIAGVANTLSNYGGTFKHKNTTVIQ